MPLIPGLEERYSCMSSTKNEHRTSNAQQRILNLKIVENVVLGFIFLSAFAEYHGLACG